MSALTESLITAVKAGAAAIREVRKSTVQIILKGERDFLTSADQASQDAILPILKRDFPTVFILPEEQSEHTLEVDTYFTVDPIDGTYNFTHGNSEWGITIGYVEKGYPKAGVIFLPDQDILVVAEKDAGCFLNGNQVKLSHSKALDQSLIGSEAGWFIGEKLMKKYLLPLAERCLGVRCLLGATPSTVEILRGRSGGYVNPKSGKVWDFAAGTIAIEEAGGACYSMTGERLRWNEVYMGVIFAASPALGDEIVDIFRTNLPQGAPAT